MPTTRNAGDLFRAAIGCQQPSQFDLSSENDSLPFESLTATPVPALAHVKSCEIASEIQDEGKTFHQTIAATHQDELRLSEPMTATAAQRAGIARPGM